MPEAEIAKEVQLLDLTLEYFADDGHWTRGRYDDENGGHCLVVLCIWAASTANAIAPSATMTDRVRRLVAGNAALTRLADSHLLGLSEPGDIAHPALYLASDDSRRSPAKYCQSTVA